MTRSNSGTAADPKPRLEGGFWEHIRLGGLFLLQGMAISLWFVPFSTVLKAHGLEWLASYTFGVAAVAAFVSPMLSGTLADRHLPAGVLLRWLAVCNAVCLTVVFLALEKGVHGGWIITLLLVQYLFSAPTWGLSSVIVLSRLQNPERQFGPLRVGATYGWMLGGFIISYGLHADTSTLSGYAAAVTWLGVAAFTYLVPPVKPRARDAGSGGGGWRVWFGWDALKLMGHRDHRAILLSAGLLNIPLVAFYPFTILQLQELGITETSATMCLGQVSEVLAMYVLGQILARFGFKWVMMAAVGLSILRYVLFAFNTQATALVGVLLHGFCYTFFFIPGQIYLEKRVDPAIRFRAQALLTLIIAGFGNFLGAVACGALRSYYTPAGGTTNWMQYWLVLASVVAVVGVYFFWAYRDTRNEAGTASAAMQAACDDPRVSG